MDDKAKKAEIDALWEKVGLAGVRRSEAAAKMDEARKLFNVTTKDFRKAFADWEAIAISKEEDEQS